MTDQKHRADVMGVQRRTGAPWPATLVAAAVALLGTGGKPAQAADPHDGTWSVTFAVREGDCTQRALELYVSSGHITHHGSGLLFHASGLVSADGSLQANLSALGQTATAQGRLSVDRGSGTWALPASSCSGQWTARRVGT